LKGRDGLAGGHVAASGIRARDPEDALVILRFLAQQVARTDISFLQRR